MSQDSPKNTKIITINIFPPIPTREFDWCAFYYGTEENGHYGYGPTEQAAIQDLLENQLCTVPSPALQ
jgi:hypothetical protein